MLWFKKQKIHEPFGNDFNLVTIRLNDPLASRTAMHYTFPDNWICQIIGATLYFKAGAFGTRNPWIEVKRRGRFLWIIPYSQAIVANLAQDICWGVNLANPLPNSTTGKATAPLPDYCYVEGGDVITFDWMAKSIDDLQNTGTIYLKQWIIY